MSKRYFLVNKSKTNSNPNKVALVGQLFLKLEDQNIHISENGGPVLVFVQDDVVTVKVEAEVKDLYFNDHLVKKGGLYFLEKSDRLNYKSNSIEIESQEALTQSLPDITEEKTRLLVQSSLNQSSKAKIEPPQSQERDETDDIVFKVDNKKDITRTSIDINELLNKAKKNKTNHKKFNEKAKKIEEKNKKPGSELAKMRPKKPQPIKLPKHKRNFKSELIVGPFIRTFSFVSEILLVIYISPLILDMGISDLSTSVQNFLNSNFEEYLVTIAQYLNLNILLPYIISYAVISIISAIIFSTSVPLFLIGVTTQGSFLEKRIKAFLRSILNLVTLGLIIFDLPILVGKMSFKEFVTRACIEYRSRFIKVLSMLNLIIVTMIGIFHIPISEIVESQNFSYEMIQRAQFDETQTKTKDIFRVSKKFAESFSAMGISNPKINYLLVHDKTSNYISLKEFSNINYKDLSFLREKIAFFGFFYPELNKYLNGEEVDPINLKTNIVNLFESADILMTKDFFSLTNLNIFSMNEVYKFLKNKNISPSSIKIINDFNKLYKVGDEYTLVTITNSNIRFIAIESSYNDIEFRLDNLLISNLELFKNPLDQAITSGSNLLSLEEYSKNIEHIKTIMLESKEIQSIGTYNKFIQDIINKIPANKGYIKDYLNKKMIL